MKRPLNGIGLFFLIGLCLIFPLKIVIMLKVLYINVGPKTLVFRYLAYFLLNSIIFLSLLKFGRKRWFLTYYLVTTCYLNICSVYFIYFNLPFSLSQVLQMIGYSRTLMAHRGFIFPLSTLLLFVDLPLVIYITWCFKSIHDWVIPGLKRVNLIFFLLLVSYVIIHIIAYMDKSPAKLWKEQRYMGSIATVKNFGFLPHEAVSLYRTFFPDKNNEVSVTYSKKLFTTWGISSHPNIICLQLESIDASVINIKYQGKYVMPFLHGLSQRYIYYPFMLTYHGCGGTSDAEFTIINSTSPSQTNHSMRLREYPNSIFLQIKGVYDIKVFHNITEEFYNRDSALAKMGVGEYIGLRRMKLKESGWGASDHDVFAYIQNMLKAQREPYLYYYLTMSSHIPYTYVPKDDIEIDFESIKNNTQRNAFQAFRYVDRQLEWFINSLDRKNTYVFLWGDHTAPLVKFSDFPVASVRIDSDFMEFVPLVIMTPDNKNYREDHFSISFLDLAPTLLALSGVKGNIRTDGVNLLPKPTSHPDIKNKQGLDYSATRIYQLIKVKLAQ